VDQRTVVETGAVEQLGGGALERLGVPGGAADLAGDDRLLRWRVDGGGRGPLGEEPAAQGHGARHHTDHAAEQGDGGVAAELTGVAAHRTPRNMDHRKPTNAKFATNSRRPSHIWRMSTTLNPVSMEGPVSPTDRPTAAAADVLSNMAWSNG
jgi:hypothetical protein